MSDEVVQFKKAFFSDVLPQIYFPDQAIQSYQVILYKKESMCHSIVYLSDARFISDTRFYFALNIVQMPLQPLATDLFSAYK